MIDLAQRRAAVRAGLAAGGARWLVAAATGYRWFDADDPVVHLSGYRSVGDAVVVLGAEGRAALIVAPAWDAERVAAGAGAGVEAHAVDDVVAGLQAVLERWGFDGGAVATAGFDELPRTLATRLGAVIGPGATGCDDALYAIEPRKTGLELARARRAAAIAEDGFARLLEIAHVGMRECDLALELNAAMKALGADDNFTMLSAGPHARGVMPSSTRALAAGDIILAELTPSCEGQFVQICRTAFVGTPPAALREKYDLVTRAMWAGIETVRPGLPMAEVCRGVDRVLEAEGYGEYCRPPHIRRRGHGFGYGAMAPGDVALDNSVPLQEDMLFIVHPNQYLPETGYMLCGEPVRVTAEGVEVLTTRTAALGTIAV